MPTDPLVATLRAAGCVFAEEEADLLLQAATDDDGLALLVARRVAGEPLEHVLRRVRFAGLDLRVDPGVFVPRTRTALLVDEAVRALTATSPALPRVVLDLCCGCGALGAAVAARVPGVQVHASDVSAAAVACARANLLRHSGRVHLGDLDAAVPATLRGRVGALLANVPYVPTAALATMPREARLHEPAAALDGGEDGLRLAARVAAAAPAWLAPGGVVLVEVTPAQAPALVAAFAANGLAARVVADEESEATAVCAVAVGR